MTTPRTTTEQSPTPSGPGPTAAAWATFGVFATFGLLLSSWIARIASVRAALHIGTGELGVLLLSISAGAICTLPGAGRIVGRLGRRRTVSLASSVSCIGMAIVALGSSGPVPLLACGLFLLGVGFGAWDVAMNVEGAAVEQVLGRSIMPRFHAGFSVGTVVGALAGAAVEVIGISARVHLLAVAGILGIVTPVIARNFLPEPSTDSERHVDAVTRVGVSPWRERRTICIGLFVLAFAFTEGSAGDWLGVATTNGFHRSAAAGSFVYGLFVASMTVGRFGSTRLLDRFGRVTVLRVSAGVAAIGVGCVITGPSYAFDVVGSMVWGLGTAAGFPVGMSAAADDPDRSHARVGTVATIAYTAFLTGPPLIGAVGDRIGVRHALALTAVLAIVGLGLAGTTRREDRAGGASLIGPPGS